MSKNEKPEKPEECSSCGYKTEQLEYYDAPGGIGGWLCKVCASTYAGSAFSYPRLYQNIEIMQQISFTTNMILDAIEELRRHNERNNPY